MDRQLISSGVAVRAARRLLARGARRDHVCVAGTAPIMPDGDADPPPTPTARRSAASRSSSRARARPARASSTSSARGSTSPSAATSTRSAARTARSSADAAGLTTGRRHAAARSALARRDRGGSGRSRREADLPALDHGQGIARTGAGEASVLDHRSGRATRTRSASRRSTCSSTARRSTSSSTSTPCSRPSPASELEARINAGADAVGARDHDAGLPHRRRRRARSCAAARRTSTEVAARTGPARRLGRHAPVQPLRAAADHRQRPLPQPRRPAPVRRPARADLRHARPRRRRRPGEGDPGRERAARPPPAAAGAVRELAVLARRADRPRRRAARWSSPRSRAPARRRASATTPTTPRSSASSSAPAASPTTRTSGGTSGRTRASARSRCASATRSRASRTSSRSPRTASRSSSSTPSASSAARRSRRYHRILTTENKWLAARYGLEAPVMDLATGRRNRVPVAQLVRRTLRDARAARARARLRARARGDPRDPRPRQRRRRPAARLQREPRHRRGRARDRGRDRSGSYDFGVIVPSSTAFVNASAVSGPNLPSAGQAQVGLELLDRVLGRLPVGPVDIAVVVPVGLELRLELHDDALALALQRVVRLGPVYAVGGYPEIRLQARSPESEGAASSRWDYYALAVRVVVKVTGA